MEKTFKIKQWLDIPTPPATADWMGKTYTTLDPLGVMGTREEPTDVEGLTHSDPMHWTTLNRPIIQVLDNTLVTDLKVNDFFKTFEGIIEGFTMIDESGNEFVIDPDNLEWQAESGTEPKIFYFERGSYIINGKFVSFKYRITEGQKEELTSPIIVDFSESGYEYFAGNNYIQIDENGDFFIGPTEDTNKITIYNINLESAVLATPIMTAATHAAGIASASSERQAGEEAWRAFDRQEEAQSGDADFQWVSDVPEKIYTEDSFTPFSGWEDQSGLESGEWDGDRTFYTESFIKLQFTAAKKIIKIGLVSFLNYSGAALQASNDNVAWTTLDAFTSSEGSDFERDINNSQSYEYYRLYITQDGFQSNIYLNEFYMYEGGLNYEDKRSFIGGVDPTSSDTVKNKFVSNKTIKDLNDYIAQIADEGLLDGSVTTPKLAPSAVTAEKIATNAIESNKIIAGAVTETKIADYNVTSNKIAPDSVIEGKLAAGAVTETKLGALSVSLGKLADTVQNSLIPPGAIMGLSYNPSESYVDLTSTYLTNPGFESWASANNANDWTETGIVTQWSAERKSGTYSAKLGRVSTASQGTVSKSISLGYCKVRVRAWFYVQDSGGIGRLSVAHATTVSSEITTVGQWLQAEVETYVSTATFTISLISPLVLGIGKIVYVDDVTVEVLESDLINAPSGFLFCNGAKVAEGDYPALYAKIGLIYTTPANRLSYPTDFYLPDYRGLFLRGLSENAVTPYFDVDSNARLNRGDGIGGNHVGTKQLGRFQSHAHTNSGYGGNVVARSSGISNTSGSVGAPNTGSSGGNETRPLNINVIYLIKY